MFFKLIFVLTLFLAQNLASAEKRVEKFGMEMAVKAFKDVCWWEYLKRFPPKNANRYDACSDSLRYIMWQLSDPESSNAAKDHPEAWVEYFGKFSKSHLSEIPEVYEENCGKYMTDGTAKPKFNEGDALGDDGKTGYPFQAFAYCLLHTLRSRHGDKAIQDLKEPRPQNKEEWEQDMLKVHNQYRALHGVKPLKLLPTLSGAAQSWADRLSMVCVTEHNKGSTPDYYYKGKMTGENLHGGNDDDFTNTGITVPTSWYDEIKSYPYPEGWHGQNDEDWKNFGHFTQMVWKGSQYVGFGYSYNATCKDMGTASRHVVARYYPPGNVQGTWKDNVLPPKDDTE